MTSKTRRSALEDVTRHIDRLAEEALRAKSLLEEAMAAAAAPPPSFDSADEDALAVAAFDRAVADYDPDEALPFELFERISDGESPIKVWREHRGLTQAALAEAAGLRQGSLSDLERGRRSASFEAFCRLADALDVTLDDLRPPAD